MRFLSIMVSACLLLLSTAGADTNKAISSPDSIANSPEGASVIADADLVEREYRKILEDDDQIQAEVDRIIQDNEKFRKEGAGVSPPELRQRVREKLEPIRKEYEDFLKRHPNHANARVAYGSFLGDLNDEEGAKAQLEQVLGVVTNNPAVYNNLANIYGHHGPVKKAFEFYEKAIALNPSEAVYYQNFATTVFLFRVDAREYYGITEQQVFDKALNLYSNALRLDPTNFPLASDVAQTYYGIKPPRTEEALKSWTNALAIAHDEIEREGVYIHLARIKLHADRFDEARSHLNAITNDMYLALKQRLTKNIEDLEPEFNRTNKQQNALAPKPASSTPPSKPRAG